MTLQDATLDNLRTAGKRLANAVASATFATGSDAEVLSITDGINEQADRLMAAVTAGGGTPTEADSATTHDVAQAVANEDIAQETGDVKTADDAANLTSEETENLPHETAEVTEEFPEVDDTDQPTLEERNRDRADESRNDRADATRNEPRRIDNTGETRRERRNRNAGR